MKRTLRKTLSFAGVLIGSAFLASCDELFPPYETPQNVLAGSISVRTADTVSVFYYAAVDYYVSNTVVTLDIDVVNTYDDLLQGDAHIGDRLTIQGFGPNPSVIVVPITLGSLRSPSVFRGTVALPPKDTARFRIPFVPMDKNNRPAYVGMPFVIVDSSKIYGPVEYIASADIRLFERVQSFEVKNFRFQLYFKERILSP